MILDRRSLIGGIAAFAAGAAPAARAAGCLATPAGPEGPVYPVAFDEADADLTRVAGGGRAEGALIEVTGRVTDQRCRAIAGVTIDVWQANAVGRYAHPRDAGNPRPLDAGFQSQARLVTDEDGEYRFLSIMPGAYPATSAWWRPPHIHYRLSLADAEQLTTQLYFAGQELNADDRILAAVPDDERQRVVVDFSDSRADGVARGRFDLVLASI